MEAQGALSFLPTWLPCWVGQKEEVELSKPVLAADQGRHLGQDHPHCCFLQPCQCDHLQWQCCSCIDPLPALSKQAEDWSQQKWMGRLWFGDFLLPPDLELASRLLQPCHGSI